MVLNNTLYPGRRRYILLFDSIRVSCRLYSKLGVITLFVLINDFGVGSLWFLQIRNSNQRPVYEQLYKCKKVYYSFYPGLSPLWSPWFLFSLYIIWNKCSAKSCKYFIHLTFLLFFKVQCRNITELLTTPFAGDSPLPNVDVTISNKVSCSIENIS